MGYDGTLKFDTSIDSSGFQSGLSKLSGMASGAIKATARLMYGMDSQRTSLQNISADIVRMNFTPTVSK